MANIIWEKSIISCKKKDIFFDIYNQRGACGSGNITTSTILICQ